MSKYTPTAPETDELEKLLAEATEIASERREKSAESHMFAMAARNAMPPGNADGWQMAADYALRTARILEQTADIAADLIRLRAEVATLRASEARMREALEPRGDTKAAYMGEFSVPLPDTDEDGNEVMRQINVPWTTIKQIMAAISARAALQGETK